MSNLIFRVKKAGKNRRSPIEIVLGKNKLVVDDTDEILSALDRLLKKSKIKIESLKDIKIEIDKEAGLTSQRIVKAIIKALSVE